MSADEILKILQINSDVFILDTILARIIRELLWGIVKVLGYIVDSIATVTDKLFILDTFYNDPGVVDFINSVKPLIAVLFALSLLGIGYQLMFSKTKEFRKIGMNVLVAIAVILVLPMAMDKMNTLTNYGVNAVKGNPPDLTNQIIKSNITDLITYDKINFNANDIKNLKNTNEINVNAIRQIDATSIIEPDRFNTLGLENKDIFKKKIEVSKDGNLEVGELNQGWMTFWKEYYYRFNINFLNIILSLGVIGATLAFTCFKLAKMIFELAYNKFLAIIIAPIDINNGQKTKQIINNIMSTFIVVFLIAVLLKFYILFVGMCAGVKGIVGVVLLVAGSFAVIDGPNMVEKLFGIDAGLRSGFKTMAGAYMVGSAVAGGASKLGNTAKSMAGGAGKVTGSVVGASAGIESGLSNKKTDDSLYKDMDKKSADENKGESLYSDMGKDKIKGNGNSDKENAIKSSTANTKSSSKKSGASGIECNTKGNGSKGHQSLYDEVNGSSGNMPESICSSNGPEVNGNEGNQVSGDNVPNNASEPIQPIPSNIRNEVGEQPSSNNIHEPINSSNVIETTSNEGDEISGHTVSNNTDKPINQNNDTSSYQTIGQHQKERIIEKVQNNPIIKQTMESYNRGKNTGQSIRENRNNKNE
ncbi:pLS20_p028 family conjugation system transmembrane protein [Clostridium sp.]|uniref:pLS20_p028 family conjugation system transmembrane protein n=1 Tax=Clostridium sp. TaxID=1506 RepID=UPI001A3FA861|nr:hypothetical protein [Clostridium sp.]MBK5237228.1 hypothetical protein [Clostridium sp.]